MTLSQRARFLLLSFALLEPGWLGAQGYRGTVHGTVRDASLAVLPGSTVTAKNKSTGLTRTGVAGSDGVYEILELPAGEYTLEAQSGALSPLSEAVFVRVGTDTKVDFVLGRVAGISENVTVVAEAPLVNTARDVLGQVVDNHLVEALPLNGRDFGKLVALTPGVTVEGSGVAGTEKGFGQFNVDGARDRSNNYTLDGTDNNDPFLNNSALNQTGITGAPASLLPIDAIEEFNIQSQFAAEYGRNAGSVVNIITKSGSNEFHGSAFGYLRRDVFDARNYFNVETKPDGTPNPKSPFKNNQFGASLGGPIVKDKTFFFVAYEGQRERVGSDFLFLVPTPADKAAARAAALSHPLPDGTFLTSINPTLDTILNFFPQSATRGIPTTVQDTNNVDSFILKLDHQFSASQAFSVRYALSKSDQVFPLGSLGGFGNGSRLGQFSQVSPTNVQVFSVSLVSTLSERRVNEIRAGFSRYKTSFSSADSAFDPATIGLRLGAGDLGLPEFDFAGLVENLGATGFSVPRGRTSHSFQVLDNFTLVTGRQTFKFGGEYRRASIDNFNDNLGRGIFSFSPSGLSPDPVVDVLANYYQGNAFVLANTGNTQRNTFNNGFSLFAQDDFRVRPTFTLNLGLRWEYFGPLGEKNNLLSNLAADGTLQMVGSGGLDGAYNRELTDFGPRVGFAWTVRENTVLRGAAGLYYDYIPQNVLIANFTNSAGIATNSIGPEAVLPLQFNQGAFNGSTGGLILTPTGPPFSAFVTPRDLKTPRMLSWNVNVQQRLGRALSAEVGYIGSHGSDLIRLYDANQPLVTTGNRPNPNFSQLAVLASISRSNYYGFQGTLRAQNLRGLSGFLTYTYSKSLDDASDGIDFNFASAALPQNSNDLNAEYGPSTFDTRHRFTAALNWQIARGWQLNAITTVQSGRPIPILTANDTSNTFNFHQRPDLVPGVDPINPNFSPTTGYLNPLAFRQPATGTFGNLGRNAIYGPGFWNVDVSLIKTLKVSERASLELRAEVFNVFNHPNFALPTGTINPGINADGTVNASAGPAGIISQTPDVAQGNPGLGGGGPRVFQFGVRLAF
jgi:hypothetical protein